MYGLENNVLVNSCVVTVGKSILCEKFLINCLQKVEQKVLVYIFFFSAENTKADKKISKKSKASFV
jgi:hypothetical protein